MLCLFGGLAPVSISETAEGLFFYCSYLPPLCRQYKSRPAFAEGLHLGLLLEAVLA